MPQGQAELLLPLRREVVDESEEERWDRWWSITLRKAEEAADEIGRQHCCNVLGISPSTFSRQLREADGKNLHGKTLMFLQANQPSLRLARWIQSDCGGCVPPARPDRLTPEDFTRQIAAMALAGEFGAGERQKVLDLYARVEKQKPPKDDNDSREGKR